MTLHEKTQRLKRGRELERMTTAKQIMLIKRRIDRRDDKLNEVINWVNEHQKISKIDYAILRATNDRVTHLSDITDLTRDFAAKTRLQFMWFYVALSLLLLASIVTIGGLTHA